MDLHSRWSERILFFINHISYRQYFFKKMIEKLKSILANQFITGFLKNMGIIFIFKVITQIIFTSMTIIAARELGPVSMGDIGIINNIASFLMVPMVMGLNISMNKYLPVLNDKDQNEMISSTILSNIPLAIVLLTVYYLFSNMICASFNITYSFMINSMVLCVLISNNIITESFLRGQKKYMKICFLKLAFSIMFSVVLFVQFYIRGNKNVNSYLSTNYIAYAVFIIGALLSTGIKNLKLNRKMVTLVYSYGFINMLGAALNMLLTSCDLFFVKSFCTAYDTGLYSVYMSNTRNLLGLLFYDIFGVVFLPTIASMDKQMVYKKIIKYCIPVFLAVTSISVLWCSLAILVYGKKYEYNLLYIVLSSSSSGITFIYQLFYFTITMEGKEGAKFTLITGALSLPIIIFIQYICAKFLGLTGVFIAVLFINLILLFILLISVHWYRTRKKQNTAQLF